MEHLLSAAHRVLLTHQATGNAAASVVPILVRLQVLVRGLARLLVPFPRPDQLHCLPISRVTRWRSHRVRQATRVATRSRGPLGKSIAGRPPSTTLEIPALSTSMVFPRQARLRLRSIFHKQVKTIVTHPRHPRLELIRTAVTAKTCRELVFLLGAFTPLIVAVPACTMRALPPPAANYSYRRPDKSRQTLEHLTSSKSILTASILRKHSQTASASTTPWSMTIAPRLRLSGHTDAVALHCIGRSLRTCHTVRRIDLPFTLRRVSSIRWEDELPTLMLLTQTTSLVPNILRAYATP